MKIQNLNVYTSALLSAVLSLGFAACTKPASNSLSSDNQSANLRELTPTERTEDFETLRSLFKSYYGPYQYKENLLGIKIDDVLNSISTQAMNAKTDEEFAGLVMSFGASLKDGHVQISIENSASGISKYNIPILVTPIEGKAIIGDISNALSNYTGFQIGDEVVEVDGLSPMSYLASITKFKSFAKEKSNAHLIAYLFSRPSYITDLTPKSKFARVKVLTAAGTHVTYDIPWEPARYSTEVTKLIPNSNLDLRVSFADDLNSIVQGHIGQMGHDEPFFLTPQVQSAFSFEKVYPSDATMAKYGLDESQRPPIYSALYKQNGKTILLTRIASYAPNDFNPSVYMRTYAALFDDYQNKADVMVLDQTHNPGGSYCGDFYNLFARDNDLQSVEYLHADRKWINDLRLKWLNPTLPGSVNFENRMMEAWSLMVEQAYDQGKNLSDAVPLFTGSSFAQPMPTTWKKPMLVLIDELAGSCGDMFPMIVKANSRAKLFGQPTMGLGGNVEEVGQLPNSRIHVKMTRGLFFPYHPDRAPLAEEYIENNGVKPDYEYSHTVQDFRSGYVEYVKAFTSKALDQIK